MASRISSVTSSRVSPTATQPGSAATEAPKLGKLMLLKLRDDWLAAQPASTLREFHDTFLGWGDSPMRLVRSAMLGETDDGELF